MHVLGSWSLEIIEEGSRGDSGSCIAGLGLPLFF
jgi:hypothetical protein